MCNFYELSAGEFIMIRFYKFNEFAKENAIMRPGLQTHCPAARGQKQEALHSSAERTAAHRN